MNFLLVLVVLIDSIKISLEEDRKKIKKISRKNIDFYFISVVWVIFRRFSAIFRRSRISTDFQLFPPEIRLSSQ